MLVNLHAMQTYVQTHKYAKQAALLELTFTIEFSVESQ